MTLISKTATLHCYQQHPEGASLARLVNSAGEDSNLPFLLLTLTVDRQMVVGTM